MLDSFSVRIASECCAICVPGGETIKPEPAALNDLGWQDPSNELLPRDDEIIESTTMRSPYNTVVYLSQIVSLHFIHSLE